MPPTDHSIQAADLLEEHIKTFKSLSHLSQNLEHLAKIMSTCLINGNKIMWMGNGGSASQSQHFAAELVGRFNVERPGIASISLSSDTAVITAVGNDYDFSNIYSRQVESIGSKNDILVGISTSGNSINVVKALGVARNMSIKTIGMTGVSSGKMEKHCDEILNVPSKNTARIQEAHLWIGHVLCELVETKVSIPN